MKKIAAILLVCAMLIPAGALGALANSANKSFGNVPESADAIAIDGVKDAVYDQGLRISIDKGQLYGEAEPPSSSGVAWLLWQDGFLFVFAQITDPTPFTPSADTQSNQPWWTDSAEVFLDPDNSASTDTNDANAVQYRIDSTGYRSFEDRINGTNSYGGDAATANGVFDGAAVTTSTGYNVEFKIPITETAGGEIGLLLQINDIIADGVSREMVFPDQSILAESALNWTPVNWDYIVLSGTTAAAGGDNGGAAATTAPVGSPDTGDSGIAVALLAAAALGAVIVTGRAIARKRG